MPELGDKAVCKSCKTPITWTGRYWEHTDISPRHVASPIMPFTQPRTLEERVAELEDEVEHIGRLLRTKRFPT